MQSIKHRKKVPPIPESVPGESEWTEQRNAERLVKSHGSNFRYHHERGQYIVYADANGCWQEDVTGQVCRWAKAISRELWDGVAEIGGDVRKVAIKHAQKSESASGVSAMMKLAQTEPGVTVTGRELNVDPYIFNVANCSLRLTDGKPLPHSAALMLTKYAPVVYDPVATCPTFDSFMDRIMSGNVRMIRYLQRIFGLSLTADISIQELYVFWGVGANGKSVLCDLFSGMMGDYAGLAPPSLVTTRANDEHPTEIADLDGRRLVFASETEEGARLRVQLIKRLTGDATLKARYMRQDYFEFPRTFKLILATNNRPKITENTNAVWRRMRLVPFAVVIPPEEQDPQLLAKLKTEWSGVLNWAIAGYQDLLQNGMQTPEEVLAATSSYKNEQDVLADYVSARCVLGGANVKVSRNDLFTDYLSWAKQTGEAHPLERVPFLDRIRQLNGVGEGQFRPIGTDVPVRGFKGIGLAFCNQANSDAGDM